MRIQLSLLATLGLATLALAPLSSHAGAIPKADYKLKLDEYNLKYLDYQFPSGLRVLFQEDHSQPIVTVVNVIDVGSEADQLGTEGIAHEVEHLNFRAQHGDLPKNWDLLHQLGANINAYTNVDETLYATVAPVDSLVTILKLEAERDRDPVANVTEADVEAEKSIVRNEMRMNYENAFWSDDALDALNSQLFPKEWPYSRSTIGSHESIDRIDLAQVRELTEKGYTPENSTIVVVGDFSLDDVPGFLEQAFGDAPELLRDPNAPEDAPLEMIQLKPRVDCASRVEPPAPSPADEVPVVQGMVDHETVLLAWSLPGGYCDDEPIMQFAANQLSNFIYYTLVPSWEWQKQDQSVDGIGCFVSPGKTASTLQCYIEPSASGGYSGERLISKAANALYLQWERENPAVKPFIDAQYNYAKMSYMASVLRGVDEFASLFSGRAFDAAKVTHYTADPRYFSRTFNEINQVQHSQVQEFARKYITRDRMVAIIVEPMDEEERARREAAGAAGEEKTDEYSAITRDRQYDFAFDFSTMTDDAIKNVMVVPDVAKAREFTLDNGLDVMLMPHGDAPIVYVGLEVRGSNYTSPEWGLDSFAEAMHSRGADKRERELAVAGVYGESPDAGGRALMVNGSSGNLDAMLHTLRYHVGDFDWQMAGRSGWIKADRSAYNRAGEDPEPWADRLWRQRLFEGSPLGQWWTPELRARQAEWGADDVKGWVLRKYQPQNSRLVIVGKLDLDAAEASVRKYMGGWQAPDGVELGKIPYEAEVTNAPERQVLVLDKPLATQTQLSLYCPIHLASDEQEATAQVMADVLNEQAWRALREEKGVTYGAGAYFVRYPGGSSMLALSSLVQNDAAGFGVSTFFRLLEEMKAGKIDPVDVTSNKWARARRYVIGQQSGGAMLSRLLGEEDSSWFARYRDQLSHVKGGDFPALLDTCVDHEVVVVTGPKDNAEALFKDAGIDYEVVDWEALLESTLTPKELKARAKRKAAETEQAKKGEDAKKK